MNTSVAQEWNRFIAIGALEFRQFLKLLALIATAAGVVSCALFFAATWAALHLMPSTKIGLLAPFVIWMLLSWGTWRLLRRWLFWRLKDHATSRRLALDRLIAAILGELTHHSFE